MVDGLPVEQLPQIDLTALENKLEELKEALTEKKEPETVLVDDVEMTSDQVLVEILNSLQDDPEQIEKTKSDVETEIKLQESLNESMDNFVLLAEQQQATVLDQQELQLQQHEQILEGFYFVGLSIVISFAVYMFWNQLSKW